MDFRNLALNFIAYCKCIAQYLIFFKKSIFKEMLSVSGYPKPAGKTEC